MASYTHWAQPAELGSETCVCGKALAVAPTGVYRHADQLAEQLAQVQADHVAGKHSRTREPLRENRMYAGHGCKQCAHNVAIAVKVYDAEPDCGHRCGCTSDMECNHDCDCGQTR